MKKDNHLLTQSQVYFKAIANSRLCCAYLFGSVARGNARKDSDIDIAVLYNAMPEATLKDSGLDIASGLEELLGREVDLIILNRSSPDLIHKVLRDGVLIFDHNPGKRIAFEIQARNEYFDIKPYLDEYRSSTHQNTG